MAEQQKASLTVEALFKVGAHFGQIRSRRHPTTAEYIYGVKEKVEIFDLEKTAALLLAAKEYVANIASQNGSILFIGGKNEARTAVKKAAESIAMPYVASRWIGGTFTNFTEIKKRVARLETLQTEKEKGDFAKYTKKERLILDKEISNLEKYFSGIVTMKEFPKAIFVVDAKKELIAITEAKQVGIPVISLSSSDCDFDDIDVPIPGNDASVAAITYILEEITSAFKSAPKKA